MGKVKINGESFMALLDNGAQVNTIMPRYVNEIPYRWDISLTSWVLKSPV